MAVTWRRANASLFGFIKCLAKSTGPGAILKNARLHRSSVLLGVKGIELRMPSLSPTMTEGTIVRWLKKEGDEVQPGDALCEIQTDKAIVAFEVEEAGVLAKIIAPDDSKNLSINTLIGLMVEEGEDWKDVEVPADAGAPSAAPPAPASEPRSAPQQQPVSRPTSGTPATKRLLGPAVRSLLHHYGIKFEELSATGPHGVLLKGDVLSYINQKNLKPKPPQEEAPSGIPSATIPSVSAMPEGAEFLDIPLTNMRRAIAKRLSLSKSTIPHAYMSVECNMKAVLSMRSQLKKDGVTTSVNDFIIKASAMALRRVPEMNATLGQQGVQSLPTVDISIAVATDAGLITPIVKNADELGIQDISSTVKELAGRAREGKLKPHEFEGGSFSISNLGMFGISDFIAVINPPQASIMAVGRSRMVLGEDNKPQPHMTTTLSFDPRVCEQDTVASFLEAFQEHLENPVVMLSLGPTGKKDVLET